MKVVEYNLGKDIWVEFETGNRVNTNWDHFIKGTVYNPYDKTVYKIGYAGEGRFKPSENRKNTPQYVTWHGMMKRCYSDKYLGKYPTYTGCSVCEEWLNFQNFAQWYEENYYQIDNEIMELDKDILIKNNKFYSPETCIFTPRKINGLFAKSTAIRGDLPIGVYYVDEIKPYRAFIKCGGNSKNIGGFYTPEEAFNAYKEFKENYIKQLAVDYENKIPNVLYHALMNYVVEIND